MTDPHVLRFAASESPDAGAFAAIAAGRLDMVQITDVLSQPEADQLLARLPGEGRPVHPSGSDAAVRQFGLMIAPTGVDPSGPDLAVYRSANGELEAAVGAPLTTLRNRVLSLLSAIAGVPAEIPEGYGFGSVRRMPEGCGAPLHRDAYPPSDTYRELRECCDLEVQASWYVQLSVPVEGGLLRVYPDLRDADLPRLPSGEPDLAALEERGSHHTYTPAVGTLLIHAGSTRWHRVTPSLGPIPRQTLGGFCAWSRSHDRVLSWA